MGMSTLIRCVAVDHTADHVFVEFDHPCRVLSSAVLNGGLKQADRILNLKVAKHSGKPLESCDAPSVTLSNYCREHNRYGTTVGIMTAASMDSLRIVRKFEQGIEFAVLATSGLSNARRVGDRAEHRAIGKLAVEIGTINIIITTTAILTPAAMVETLMMATESKVVAVQSMAVKSCVSNALATGTGTDAMVIAGGRGPVKVRYCGKHVLFGEIIGRLVIEAVTSSLKRHT